MKLKDKTYKRFVEFFENTAKKHESNQFEIAYSDIQRETGVASITLKKAIQVLEESGLVKVYNGRNTRYARFEYLPYRNLEVSESNTIKKSMEETEDTAANQSLTNQIKSLTTHIEQLRQRLRTQEMTISVVLDRLAELEDKTQG